MMKFNILSIKKFHNFVFFIINFIASSILIWVSYKITNLIYSLIKVKWLDQITPLILVIVFSFIIRYIFRIRNKIIKIQLIIYSLFVVLERIVFLIYPNCLPSEEPTFTMEMVILFLGISVIFLNADLNNNLEKNSVWIIGIILIIHFSNYFEHKFNIMILYDKLFHYIIKSKI